MRKGKKARRRTAAPPRDVIGIKVGGDMVDRAQLVRVLEKNLPAAIASGQREIVESLMTGIAKTFPSHSVLTGNSVRMGEEAP